MYMDKVKKFFRPIWALMACVIFVSSGNFLVSNAMRANQQQSSSEIVVEESPELSKEVCSVQTFDEVEDSSVIESVDVPTYDSVDSETDDYDETEAISEAGKSNEVSDAEKNDEISEAVEADESSELVVSDESSDPVIADESTDSTDDYDFGGGYLPRTEEQQFMFEAAMYCEGGAIGTSREIQIANAWLARNKIEQEIENGSADPFRDALNPNHYQGVYDDEFGWRAVSQKEGVITQELIDSNPAIHEISELVLNGEIASPIYDWDCTQCFDYFGFDDGVAFAEDVGIDEYIIIENGIYFPASEWTERLTWYCLNF